MGARSRARERAPIYNKMKAIRGDNPRTTNQRVYLMPVVPSPPPEKPPTPDVEQFSLSFPLAFYPPTRLSSIYLSICSSPSPITLHLSLSFTLLVAPRLSLSLSFIDPPSPFTIVPTLSLSRVITLLLSDMSLCYRHSQPALFSLRSSPRALTHVGQPSSPHFPAALFATCRTLAHPRDLAQSVLLY